MFGGLLGGCKSKGCLRGAWGLSEGVFEGCFGGLRGVRGTSGGVWSEGVWSEGVWRVSWNCLDGVFELSGRNLEGICGCLEGV